VGDALLLLAVLWLVALGWGRGWLQTAGWIPCVVFLALGVAYTAVSEYVNVHLMQRWAYSRWMPTLSGIGLGPLLQWLVVPTLCVWWVWRRV
jgi:hypothetical protein